MSTDKEYASFLEKANQDTSSSKAATSATDEAQITTVDTEVPPVLKKVKIKYVSDATILCDHVALKWSGKGDFGIGTLLSSILFLKLLCSLSTDVRS